MRKLLTLILSASIVSMSFAQFDVTMKDHFRSTKKGVIPASTKAAPNTDAI